MIRNDQEWLIMINNDQTWSIMINDDQCSHGVASARSWQGSGPAFITFLAQSGPRSSAKKWPVTVPTDRSSSWPKSSHPMSGLDKPWKTHLGDENMRRWNLFMFMIYLWYFVTCFLGVLLSLSLAAWACRMSRRYCSKLGLGDHACYLGFPDQSFAHNLFAFMF
jgi:hypothetical protein